MDSSTPVRSTYEGNVQVSDFRGLYDIRDVQDNDKPFIMATLLRGVYFGDPYYTRMPKDRFMRAYKVLAEAAVDNKLVNIKVACLKEDHDVIIGYSILSKDYQAIVWAFVKKNWRKRGIGRTLVPQHPSVCTHLTITGEKLLNKYPGLVFDPFYNIQKEF